MTAQEAADIDDFPAEEVMTAIGRMRLFVVNGSRPAADPDSADSVPPMEAEDETPALDVPLEDEPHHEDEPSDADKVPSDEQPELPEPPAGADETEALPLPEETEMPSESNLLDVAEEPIAETTAVPEHANPGDYIGVTEETRVSPKWMVPRPKRNTAKCTLAASSSRPLCRCCPLKWTKKAISGIRFDSCMVMLSQRHAEMDGLRDRVGACRGNPRAGSGCLYRDGLRLLCGIP